MYVYTSPNSIEIFQYVLLLFRSKTIVQPPVPANGLASFGIVSNASTERKRIKIHIYHCTMHLPRFDLGVPMPKEGLGTTQTTMTMTTLGNIIVVVDCIVILFIIVVIRIAMVTKLRLFTFSPSFWTVVHKFELISRIILRFGISVRATVVRTTSKLLSEGGYLM